MEAIIDYLGGVQFAATAGGHKIISDQPVEFGGANAGMTPPELMLASLGTCAGYYAAEYLKARSLPSEVLRVRVIAEKAAQPARLVKFRIEVESPGVEDVRHRDGVLRAVKRCLIHNTLLSAPEVEVAVEQLATIC